MKSFTPIVLALAASQQAIATPLSDTSAKVEKRQILSTLSSGLTSLTSLPSLLTGGIGDWLGTPGSTEILQVMARGMGAKKGEPGTFHTVIEKINTGYGNVPDPAGAAPRRADLPSENAVPNQKKVKIRYGPYKIPKSSHKNTVGEAGMLFNWPDRNVDRPCKGDCTIIGMQAGLETPDGKSGNIDRGLWLHHFVLFNKGVGRTDPTCLDRDVSIPHAIAGLTSQNSERIFSSGNERTRMYLPGAGVKTAGYKLKAADTMHMLVELMNQQDEDRVVYLTITYDYVEGHPAGWNDVRPIWFDVMQCGTSEYVPPNKQVFAINATTWTANFDGKLIVAGGHMHDGGNNVYLSIDGKQVCDSKTEYGTKPEYISAPMNMGGHGAHRRAVGVAAAGNGTEHAGMDMGGMAMGGEQIKHISEMSVCRGPGFTGLPIKKGQKWDLGATYDFNKNKVDSHGGPDEKDKIMGIAIMYTEVASK